ncbi:protein tyrosine phosphatase family protein [Microcoleus sp. FACHB-53]|nr:protein tyrosine phosphatase family protein [Microcoleus sp. FACHB-53]
MNTNQIEQIYNYLKLSDSVATGGQPTEAQFSLIKEAGYQVVVNLARPDSPKAIPNEQALVESLGMGYASIPVDWENPTLEDVARFFSVMEAICASPKGRRQRRTQQRFAIATQPVFVHCAANMRVSAFMYLYRLIYEGISDEQAKSDLQKIWTPNDTWQAFIQQVIEHYQLLSQHQEVDAAHPTSGD